MAEFLIDMRVPAVATYTRRIEADTLANAIEIASSDPHHMDWCYSDTELDVALNERTYQKMEG